MKRLFAILMIFALLCACSCKQESVVEESTPEPTLELEEFDTKDGISGDAELLTPIPTEEPTATPEPTEEPTPTPDGLCGGRFPDKFSDTPVKGENSYKSKNVGIEITKYDTDKVYGGKVVYFVVDIYVQDVTLIRAEAARGDFSKAYAGLVEDIAKNIGAIVAINGDVYYRKTVDIVIRDGVTYRKRTDNDKDLCVLLRDGRMLTFVGRKYKTQEILDLDPWQVWSFGPSLLDENGEVRTSFPNIKGRIKIQHPRTAFGYFEPGHYCWVVADGRQPGYSDGLRLEQLGQLMKDLGCKEAYNLDGGGSSVLFWDGEIISSACNANRTITDIIYILPEE